MENEYDATYHHDGELISVVAVDKMSGKTGYTYVRFPDGSVEAVESYYLTYGEHAYDMCVVCEEISEQRQWMNRKIIIADYDIVVGLAFHSRDYKDRFNYYKGRAEGIKHTAILLGMDPDLFPEP